MNKLDGFSLKIPYFREWVLGRVTRKYFHEYFDRIKGGVVLEIGCGNGAGAKIIKKLFSPKTIVASDLDSSMIAYAKNYVRGSSIRFEVADAAKLPYKNDSFDAAFDFIAIHHIPSPDWQQCLKELYRVLKPNGLAFLYDIAIESFSTPWGRVLKVVTHHPYDRMYTEQEFKAFLKKAGFTLVKEGHDTRHFAIVARK